VKKSWSCAVVVLRGTIIITQKVDAFICVGFRTRGSESRRWSYLAAVVTVLSPMEHGNVECLISP
jgi:hypothetical protein